MLIIPVERKIDWRHPPWVTLALILLNFLVFFVCRQHDERLLDQVFTTYQQEQMATLEAPAYDAYLRYRVLELHDTQAGETLKTVAQERQDNKSGRLSARMLLDHDFYPYAQTYGAKHWQPDVFAHWQQQRQQLQDELNQLSAKQQGLIPAELHPWNLLSYQFLHGGWAHIIGNMLFLFLIGFAVEQALGAVRYLLAYLATGVVAGLVFAAFSWGSMMPLVGASGAISGLMGMYVVIFGRQQIRFFYFLGFFMGYVRATALLMLPVWLLKQLYDYWASSDTHVAYMAHVGGLVAGALLVWLLGKSWLQVRKDFHAPQADDKELAFRQRYEVAMKSYGRMAFDRAEQQFAALWQRYPERFVLLEHLYQLAKLRPQQARYGERARELIALYLRKGQSRPLLRIWRDYLALGNAHSPLTADTHKQVFFAALRDGDLQAAETALAQLPLADNALFREEAWRLLLEESKRRQLLDKVRHYRQLLAGEPVASAASAAASGAQVATPEIAVDLDAPIEFK